MDIYSPINITENCIKNFLPTRLYIKKHKITGLRYLGKYTKEDIENYLGSGKRWNNHIKKHGKESIITEWVSDWFNDPILLQEIALFISKEYDIVNSNEWANLKPEYGIEGHKLFGKSNGMYGSSRTGENNPFYKKEHTKKTKELISKKKKGKKQTKEFCENRSKIIKNNNPMNNIESVEKLRQSALKRSKLLCVYCDNSFDPGNFKKYHSEKCRHKPPN